MEHPVHGAGLLDKVSGGEKIRNPIHVIVDPAAPQYGAPYMIGTPGGSTKLDPTGTPVIGEVPDSGGFGHDQPVQWHGHHRAAVGAIEQQRLRESGEKNWGVPVPFDLHHGTCNALKLDSWISASEMVSDDLHEQRKSRAAAGAAPGSPGPMMQRQATFQRHLAMIRNGTPPPARWAGLLG